MTAQIVRLCDFERRSKQPDAAQPRNPCEADVIVLPVVRIERDPEPHDRFPAMPWSQ